MARDKSWDSYDADIRTYVAEVNRRFANVTHYKLLDWRIIKAIVWTEVMGGPDTAAWKTRPMQIGNAGDDGWETLTETISLDANQIAKARLIAPPDLKTQMIKFGRNDARTNLRAGTYWLCYKAVAFHYVRVNDSMEDRTYALGKRESPSTIASKLQTTPTVIVQDSKLAPQQVYKLQAGHNLHYHKAHMEWQVSSWSGWESAVNAYNGVGNGAGDDRYMEKFRANLKEIMASYPSAAEASGRK